MELLFLVDEVGEVEAVTFGAAVGIFVFVVDLVASDGDLICDLFKCLFVGDEVFELVFCGDRCGCCWLGCCSCCCFLVVSLVKVVGRAIVVSERAQASDQTIEQASLMKERHSLRVTAALADLGRGEISFSLGSRVCVCVVCESNGGGGLPEGDDDDSRRRYTVSQSIVRSVLLCSNLELTLPSSVSVCE